LGVGKCDQIWQAALWEAKAKRTLPLLENLAKTLLLGKNRRKGK